MKQKIYKIYKFWWVRTSIERKKDYNKEKIVVSEDTLLGWKKSLGNGDSVHSFKNKRLSKKKDLVSEDIYWEKKKTATNKILWWVRTHFWGEKNSLGLVSEEILWREKRKTIREKRAGEEEHLLREKKDCYY